MCFRRSFVSSRVSELRDVRALDEYVARRRLVETGEQMHQRRLPGPRRPHHRRQLLPLDLKIDRAEGIDRGVTVAVAAAELLGSNDGPIRVCCNLAVGPHARCCVGVHVFLLPLWRAKEPRRRSVESALSHLRLRACHEREYGPLQSAGRARRRRPRPAVSPRSVAVPHHEASDLPGHRAVEQSPQTCIFEPGCLFVRAYPHPHLPERRASRSRHYCSLPCRRVAATSAACGATSHRRNSAGSSPSPGATECSRATARTLGWLDHVRYVRHVDHPDEIVVRGRRLLARRLCPPVQRGGGSQTTGEDGCGARHPHRVTRGRRRHRPLAVPGVSVSCSSTSLRRRRRLVVGSDPADLLSGSPGAAGEAVDVVALVL